LVREILKDMNLFRLERDGSIIRPDADDADGPR